MRETDTASPESVRASLDAAGYLADSRIATTVFLAARMERPILAEGPAGVGKTELAKAMATVLDTDLVRLQCYEGLDEAKALYEWEYPKQLLYAQMLRDKLAETLAGTTSLREAVDRIAVSGEAFFSERFLVARPLLRAIRSEQRVVLLVDEIDRAEPEFEAFLLEVLAEMQVTVPEIGTLRAVHPPLVFLTSNNARELTDALRRRCLHLHIGYPDAERELAIVRRRVPGVTESLATQVVRAVQAFRGLDLKKRPSVSETVDWVRALVLLGADRLDPVLARETLSLVLKYEGDADQAAEPLSELLGPPSGEPPARG